MAILSLTEIVGIIEFGRPDWIKKAEKEHKKLTVHVDGVGVAAYLDNVAHYENARQFQLRKDFATSNKHVFENILRPVDKIFSAKGGNKLYDVSTESKEKELKNRLSNFDSGYSVTDWIQKIQANKFYTDPNGLVFFEVNDGETYPTIKSISSIFNYQSNGRLIEWVVFQPEKRSDAKGNELPGDFYRVVDDSKDYLIYVVDDNFTIIEDETFDIQFPRVPAIINSDLIDSNLIFKKSPIDSVIELADHYLTTSSVKNIYEFLHGYPIFWAYVQPCRVCDGTGLYDGQICSSCNGDGHTFSKDVSDIIKLKPPKSNEDPQLAPDVAGYVQPDLEVWREQRNELDWIWGLMHFTMWGTHKAENVKNETATAAFLDVQPVNDRLNQFTDSFESMEKIMTDFVGSFYLGDAYKGSSINYGRRYLVESPDQIWNKYEKARQTGNPKVTLDYLLQQFYQAEFANDLESLTIAQKGVKLEPFVHKSDEEIDKLPIQQEDKISKYYFNEWFKTVPHNDIIMKDTNTLRKEYETFIKDKQNERQEV
jgi:hypothetical protein